MSTKIDGDEKGPFQPSEEQLKELRRQRISNRIILISMAVILIAMVYTVINHYGWL